MSVTNSNAINPYETTEEEPGGIWQKADIHLRAGQARLFEFLGESPVTEVRFGGPWLHIRVTVDGKHTILTVPMDAIEAVQWKSG